LRNLGGLFPRSRFGGKPPKRRKLVVEPLEGRNLLSATVFPTISGTSFYDVRLDGLTADDLRLPGTTVSLFRDGGNGQFGGDDQLVASTTTDANGMYRFDNLPPATYFVQQATAAGFVLPSGQGVAKVLITAGDTQGTAGTVIDTFDSTTQWVGGSLRTGRVGSSGTAAPEALGDYRDLYVQLTSARGSLSLGANADVPGILDFASGSASNGNWWVTWDGPGGDPQVLNPTGLGQVDLTSQGASTGIKLTFGADHDNTSVKIKVYTDGNNWSWASVPIPNTEDGEAVEEVFVPFAQFVNGGGSGADFSRVGAMRLEIVGPNAVDGQIGPIGAFGPKVLTQNFANAAQTDLAIAKTHAPEPATAGGQMTYTLVSTNNGPSKATGVVVSDTLPAGLTLVSVTPGQGSHTVTGSTIKVHLGSLSSGASATTTIVVNVGPTATGTISNTATIMGNETDPNLANNTSTTVTQLNAQVDLAITKANAPNPVVAGRQLTYTLTTANNGPSAATGVTITDTLPAGVTFASSSGQGQVTASEGTLTISLGNLAVGASMTTTLVVNVDPATTGTLTNTASVRGDQPEANMSNNVATAVTTVNPQIDLAITKTASAGRVVAGRQLTYTLTTINNGPSRATGVRISDALPAGVTFVSAGGQGTVTQVSGGLSISLGDMPVGASATTTVLVTVKSSATGTITNSAEVRGNETETNLANNKASVTTQIDVPVVPQGDPDIDLSVTKTASPDPVAVGANLTYTLVIRNRTANQTAHNVLMTDTLPAGLTVVSVSSNATRSGNTVQASFSQLAGGGSVTVTIVARVDSAPAGTITNTARVQGREPDPVLSNNASTVITGIRTPTPLGKRRYISR
jgi:uncharacterized repeat protein (TIGR01451 family)